MGVAVDRGQGRRLTHRPQAPPDADDGGKAIDPDPAGEMVEQVRATVQPPAEDEGGDKAAKRGRIGDETGIRRRNAEPHQPGCVAVKGQGNRRRQNNRDQVGARQHDNHGIQHPSEDATDVQQVGQQLDDHRPGVEQQQKIQEPQMRQGQGRDTQRRRGRRRDRRRPGGRRIGDDDHDDDRSEDQRPKDDQRQGDAL